MSESDFKKYNIFSEISYDYMMYKANNMEILSQYDYNIISLGIDCLPHVMSIQSGIKDTIFQGGLPRLPFDTAVNPLPVILDALENDFKNYMATDIITRDIDNYSYFIGKNGLAFNHDTPDMLKTAQESINNFNNKLLRKRINNFLLLKQLSNCLYLLHIKFNGDLDILHKIQTIISDKYNGKLFILNYGEEITGIYNFEYINFNFPNLEGYRWPKPSHFITNRGYDLQYTIIESIKYYIMSNFNKKPFPVKNYFKFYKSPMFYIQMANYHLCNKDFMQAMQYINYAKLHECFKKNSMYDKAVNELITKFFNIN